MEGSCSTGQSPQRAVVPVKEEEELISILRQPSGQLKFKYIVCRKCVLISKDRILILKVAILPSGSKMGNT
jgi:hypothetical protein